MSTGADEASAPNEAAARRPWSIADGAVLIVVLAICAIVEWKQIQHAPSFDELWHLMLSAGRGTPVGYFPRDTVVSLDTRLTSLTNAQPLWRVWTTLDGMPHPPLYFVTLRLWRDVFGEGDRVAHAFSIACACIGVGFTFGAARLAMDRWAAALVGLTLGCAQTQVYLAQEMRPYALATALAAVALWLMTRVEVLGPTRRIAIVLAALTLPLMLTHYFTIGACATIGLYGLLRLKPHRRVFIAAMLVAAAVFCFGWLPFAIRQARDVGPAGGYLHVEHVDVLREVGLVACAPFRLIADRDYLFEELPLVTGVLFVVPWFLCRRFRSITPWVAMLCGAILPVFLVDVFGSREHLTVIRYSAVAAPAVMLLFAGCAWAIDRRIAYLTAATALATGVIYLVSRNPVFGECPDFSATVGMIEREAKAGDGILCYRGTAPDFYTDMFALSVSHSRSLLPRPLMIFTRHVQPNDQVKLGRRAWLISGKFDRPVDELVPGARVVYTKGTDVEVTLTLLDLPTGDRP